jgi:hypothetical protein
LKQSSAVHIQALVSADGILPGSSSKLRLLVINLASVPGGQLVNSPTQSLEYTLKNSYAIFHAKIPAFYSFCYSISRFGVFYSIKYYSKQAKPYRLKQWKKSKNISYTIGSLQFGYTAFLQMVFLNNF